MSEVAEANIEAFAPIPESAADEALAVSLGRIGMVYPVVVSAGADGLEAIAGRRRLAEAARAGWKTVPVRRLSEVAGWAGWDRALTRLELALRLADAERRWPGRPGVTAHLVDALGLSRPTVERALRVGRRLDGDAARALRDSAAEHNLAALSRLAALDPPTQRLAAEALGSGSYTSLDAAVASVTSPSERAPVAAQSAAVWIALDPDIDDRPWDPPAPGSILLLATTDLPAGLRLAATWGFRVVDDLVLLLPSRCARPGPVFLAGRRLHLNVLVGASSGRLPTPATRPASVTALKSGDIASELAALAGAWWPKLPVLGPRRLAA